MRRKKSREFMSRKRAGGAAILLLLLLISAEAALALPVATFVPPTPSNNSILNHSWFEVNSSVEAVNMTQLNLTLDGANYSIYDASLVLYLGFNNISAIGENNSKFVDISLYGNNGTCNATAGTCPNYVDVVLRGVEFDGVDDYIEIDDSPSLHITDELTIMAWISVGETGLNHTIVEKNGSYYLFVDSNGYLTFYTYVSGEFDKEIQYPLNLFHDAYFVAISRNSTTTKLIILEEDAPQLFVITAPNRGLMDVSNDPLRIGRRLAGTDAANGIVDELRIYNRTLSEDEIIKIFSLSYLAKLNTTRWEYLIIPFNLSDGTHTFAIWVEDNSTTLNTTGTMVVTVDTTPPVIHINSPQNNSVVNTSNIMLNVSVSDLTSTNITYEIDNNGTIFTLCNDCSNAATTLTLQDGTHTITVYATDSAGWVNSSTITVTVDTTPPVIDILSPQNTTIYTTNVLDLNISISDTTPANITYEIDSNGTVFTLCTNCFGGTTTLTFNDGIHNITVYAVDSAGWTNSSFLVFDVSTTPLNITVIDGENLQPVSGVSVTVTGYPFGLSITQPTNADGKTTVFVDKTLLYNIYADKEGYITTVLTNINLSTTNNLTVPIFGNTTINGKVIGISEYGFLTISNATVRIINNQTGMVEYVLQTDDEGYFSLRIRGTFDYTLEVDAGTNFIMRRWNFTASTELNNYTFYVYKRGLASFKMRVVDYQNGMPLDNATVTFVLSESTNFTTVTNSSGFAWIFVRGGYVDEGFPYCYRLVVERYGYRTRNETFTSYCVMEGEEKDLGSITLKGNYLMRGRLVDEFNTDLGVSGAHVTLRKWTPNGIGGFVGEEYGYNYSTISNDSGDWEIYVPPYMLDEHGFVIEAQRDGYFAANFTNEGSGYTISENGTRYLPPFFMRGAIHVKIKLLDFYSNKPVPGINVKIEELDNFGFNYPQYATYNFYTDSEGFVDAYIRENNYYTLIVGGSDSGYKPLQLYAVGDINGTYYLEGTLYISGRVLDVNRDENNATITLPLIPIKLCPSSGLAYCYDVTSSYGGNFSLYVKGNEIYKITANGTEEGYNHTTISVDGRGTDFLSVDLVLEGRSVIKGVVRDEACSDSRILYVNPCNIPNPKIKVEFNINGKEIYPVVVGDKNGAYSIRVPKDKMIRIQASRLGYNSSPYYDLIIDRDTVTKNFVLRGYTHFHGYVIDEENDRPLSNVRIEIKENSSNTTILRYVFMTDGDGYFDAYLGVTSNYIINFSKEGYLTKNETGTAFINMWTVHKLRGAGTIKGSLVDAYSGEPLHNATVELYLPDTGELIYQKKNIDGSFTIHVDNTTQYKIRAYQHGYLAWDGYSKVYPPNYNFTGENSIKLKAYFETFVYDYYNNKPIPNAEVILFFRTDEKGEYETQGLNITTLNLTINTTGCSHSGILVEMNKTDGCTPAQATRNLCRFTATTNDNGSVMFKFVPVGAYRIKVDAVSQGCGIKYDTYTLTTDMAGKKNNYTINFVRTYLKVVITNGVKPIANANVTLWNGSSIARNTAGTPLTSLTSSDGSVLFDMLQPYTYKLTVDVYSPTQHHYEKSITVREGENNVTLDIYPPLIVGTNPKNNSFVIIDCNQDSPEKMTYWVATNENTTLYSEFYKDQESTPLNYFNDTELRTNHTRKIALICGTWKWKIKVCDESNNCNNSVVFFILANSTTDVLVEVVNGTTKISNANVTFWNESGIAFNQTGAPLTDLTDTEGKVEFSGVIPTLYTLTITKLGYPDVNNTVLVFSGNNYIKVDYRLPSVTSVEPENNTVLGAPCSRGPISLKINISTSESTNISVVFYNGSNSYKWTSNVFSTNHTASMLFSCGNWRWNITICDLNKNCTTEVNYTFTIVDSTFTVNVTDENGNPLDNITVIVTGTDYQTEKNTTTGIARFTDLKNNTKYDITVIGEDKGYGNANFDDYNVVWGGVLNVKLNITTLNVTVHTPEGDPVSGALVTLFENVSGEWRVAKDALGNYVNGTTDSNGRVIFRRLLPCNNCNLTVNKSGTINWTLIDIDTGEHKIVALDPDVVEGSSPFEPMNISDDRFIITITVVDEEGNNVFENVTVKLISHLTGNEYVNYTNSSGKATFNVTSDAFDVVINGTSMGYGVLIIENAFMVGWLKMNAGNTTSSGHLKLSIDGQKRYYVLIRARGYESYNSKDLGIRFSGSYLDDVVDGYGIKPAFRIYLNGTAEISGHVYDLYFINPLDSRKNIYNATIYLYDASPTLDQQARYVLHTDTAGNFYARVSPYTLGSPVEGNAELQHYKLVVVKEGYETYTYYNESAETHLITFSDGESKNFIIPMVPIGKSYIYLYDAKTGDPINVEIRIANFTLTDEVGSPLYTAYWKEGNLLEGRFNPYYGVSYLEVMTAGYNAPQPIKIPSTTYEIINQSVYLYTAGESEMRIKVVDSITRMPIPNVSISCYLVGTSQPDLCHVVSNEDGEAVVFLGQGNYTFVFDGTEENYGTAHVHHFMESGKVEEITIELQPTSIIINLSNDLNESFDGKVKIRNAELGLELENATQDGKVQFLRLPLGNYTITYVVSDAYIPVSAPTAVELDEHGKIANITAIFNETRYSIHVINTTGTPLSNIQLCLNTTTCAETNGSGLVFFREMTPGNYTLEMNALSAYKAGYFPAEPRWIEVKAGGNEKAGNNLTLVLNSTSGYAILHILVSSSQQAGTMVYVYSNGTLVKTINITEEGAENFVLLNSTTQATNVMIKATKPRCNDFKTEAFNLTDQEVKDIYVSFYCPTPSHGKSYEPTTSIAGTSSVVTQPTEKEDEYKLSVYATPVSVSVGGCTIGTIRVTNKGKKIITNLRVKDVTSSTHSITFESSPITLLPNESVELEYSLCLYSYSSDIYVLITSDQISTTATAQINIVSEEASEETQEDVYETLMNTIDNMAGRLTAINRESLPQELQQLYDEASSLLASARDDVMSGNYEAAQQKIARASNYLNQMESYLIESKEKPAKPWKTMLIVIVSLGLLGLFGLMYYTRMSSSTTYSYGKRKLSIPSLLPFARARTHAEKSKGVTTYKSPTLPATPPLMAGNVPVTVARTTQQPEPAGRPDLVYFTEPVARDEYLTYLKKAIESKERCPSCGMRLVNGRCLRCD